MSLPGSVTASTTPIASKKKSRKRRNEKYKYEVKLCILFGDASKESYSLLVIRVGQDKISKESVSIVKVPYWVIDVGVGSLGPKCYIIGGGIDESAVGKERYKFPRDVLICNFNRRKDRWKKGPRLKAGKPWPIVVTVKGKIYALAGYSRRWGLSRGYVKPEKLFEVFDPNLNFWRVLPEPPFISLYEQGHGHPNFVGHTVIGSIIYFQVLDLFHNRTLYIFNVDTEKWVPYDDSTHHYLRLGYWFRRADVIDELMLLPTNNGYENLCVYGYDLAAWQKADDIGMLKSYSNLELLVEDDTKENYEYFRSRLNEYIMLEDDNDIPIVPVFGLTHVKCEVPYDGFYESFVTHLKDNLFALVRLDNFWCTEKKDVRVNVWICIFEAHLFKSPDGKRYVVADKVRVLDSVSRNLGLLYSWCSVLNDGQSMKEGAGDVCPYISMLQGC